MSDKTVALVGMSRSSRHMAPFDNPDIEIWSLNKAWRDPSENDSFVKRWDRWFEIHSLSTLTEQWGDLEQGKEEQAPHLEWLKRDHGDRPIYMAEAYPWFPNAVRYPIETVVARFGHYFTSTMAYMIGLALLDPDIRRIECYGFEMRADNTDYVHQLPCVEYFRGLAKGTGVEMVFPPIPAIWDQPLYGYEDMTAPYMNASTRRTTVLKNTELKERLNAMAKLAKSELAKELLENPAFEGQQGLLEKIRDDYMLEFHQDETRMNMAIAAANENARFRSWLGHHPTWTYEDKSIESQMTEEFNERQEE